MRPKKWLPIGMRLVRIGAWLGIHFAIFVCLVFLWLLQSNLISLLRPIQVSGYDHGVNFVQKLKFMSTKRFPTLSPSTQMTATNLWLSFCLHVHTCTNCQTKTLETLSCELTILIWKQFYPSLCIKKCVVQTSLSCNLLRPLSQFQAAL